MEQNQQRDQGSADTPQTARRQICDPVVAETVGATKHVNGQPIRYAASPPAAGDHRSRWEALARNFYDVETRPAVPVLVHNLEHGYNILWYDETVAGDAESLAQVKQIAERYAGPPRDPATAFIAAPWTSEDGAPFPADRHYALTHWYADPADQTRSRADEIGYTRYCADLSSKEVQDWMRNYPLKDSPEGFRHSM